MLEKGPLGGVLDRAYERAGKDTVVDLYLEDFSRMVYHSSEQKDVEYQVCLHSLYIMYHVKISDNNTNYNFVVISILNP